MRKLLEDPLVQMNNENMRTKQTLRLKLEISKTWDFTRESKATEQITINAEENYTSKDDTSPTIWQLQYHLHKYLRVEEFLFRLE